MKKRLLSAFMALALCLTLLPAPAWAAEADAPEGGTIVQEEQQEKAPAAESPAVSEQAAGAVAEVDGTTYSDLIAAFDEAQEKTSATVKLLADVATNGRTSSTHGDYGNGYYVFDQGNVTFDLNGHTLTWTKYDAYRTSLLVGKNGRLTVCDGGTDGKIYNENAQAINIYAGTLIIQSGTLMSESGKALKIDGGVVSITGGTIHSGHYFGEGVSISPDTVNNRTATLTISGGAELKGGTNGSGLYVDHVGDENPLVKLSGGTYTGGSNGIECNSTTVGTLLDEGCRYMLGGSDVTDTGVAALGSGVTVEADPNAPVEYIDADGNPAKHTNCTEITAETWDISQGWHVVKENVTISGLNISGEVNLILCDGATLTVTSFMNVSAGSTLNLFWQSAGSGKLTAADISVLGTVTAPAGEMKQTSDSSGTTFEKCFEHDWEYTNNGDTHTATCKLCGKDGGAVNHSYTDWTDNSDGTHTGKCVCEATAKENHTPTYTPNADGLTHSTKCSKCGYTAAVESHNFNQTDNYGKKCACGAYLAAEYNGQQYATLARAIEAAKNGGTVTLQMDVGERITVNDGMNVTIDLNNNGWTTDGNTAHATLVVTGGSVTVQNGRLTSGTSSNAYTAVEVEGGKLTVGEDMTIQGGSMDADRQFLAIDVKGGELVLSVGAKLDGGLTMSGDARLKNKLTAGTFTNSGSETYSVSVEDSDQYTTVFDLLETGYAFAVYNEDALTGDVIAKDTTTRELTEDVAVIKCTHKDANNKSLFKDNTCTGCGFTCAHETVEKGVCTVCGAQMVAQDNIGKYYIDLAEAFEGVADGGTVTMLTTLKDDDTINFCRDAEGNPVEKNVTLMMNGHSLSYEGTSSLNIESGKLIIGDEATISQPAQAAQPAVFVDNTERSKDRGTLEFKGKANLTGGLLIQNWGKLVGGLKEGTIITSNSTYSVSVARSDTYGNVLGLLGDGLAFAKYDESAENKAGAIVDGSVKQLTEDVIVVAHKHSVGEDNKCACGYTCPHNDFKDGKCTICGNRCAHTNVDENGLCGNCKTQMAVKIETGGTVTYGTDFKSAMRNATNGTKITLLADVSIVNRTGISGDGTAVTLDLNGHKITSGWLDVGGKDTNETYTTCTLKIIGKGSYEPPMYGGIITVDVKATLDLSEWEGGTISSINISDNSNYEAATREAAVIVGPKAGTIGKLTFGNNQLGELKKTKLSGGSFNEIWAANHQPVKLGDLLVSGYALQYEDGSYEQYTKTLQNESIYNVKVVKCPHAKINEDGHCAYCNATDFVAQVTAADGSSSAYTDIAAAIAAADGGTVNLLANAGEITIGSPLKLDLNGKTAAKLTVTGDVTLASLLPEGCAFKSGSTWITDLTGTELTNVSMAKLPIKSMAYETKMSMTYGGMGTLLVKVTKEPGTGAVTFQWYKVEGGKETAVGSATTKNQFDLSALKLPAGQHTFRFSATCDGYKKMSQDIAVTVQRASISASRITPPTAQENLTYTGQEQALITAGSVTSGGTMQYSLTENGTYSQNIPVGTDAGTYTVWYRVIGDANHNDTAPASVVVSIGKKPLTITGVTAVSKPYDGTTNADITSVTFDNVTLNQGTDYNVTASFEDAGVGSGKNVTATVTLIGQAAQNYALEQSSFPTTGGITKAAAPDFTKETALVIVNGHEKTYTVTLPAMPTLETPKEYGALTYEISEIKLDVGYYTDGAKVENGKLTLPIQKNDVETTGSVGTVTVVIKSTNYEDITLTVNISAKNKLTPVLAGTLTLTPIKITYGEPLSKIKITGTMKAGDTVVEGTFSWQLPGNTILDASTSGHTVEWTFTPKDGNTYTEVTGTVKVPVAPKSIEGAAITLEKYEFQYNAAEQSPRITGVTLEDWSETRITYDIKSGDKATNANDSIPLTIEGTGNYTGTAMVEWKITPKTVTPTIEVEPCTYTGDALEPAVTLKDGDAVIPAGEYTAAYSNNTNAGVGQVTITNNDGGNYVIQGSTQDFTIDKVRAPAAEVGSLTITNGLHKTYSFDLSTLLPKLTAPCNYGTITYDRKVDTNLGVGSFITLVDGKTGELTLDANRSGTDEGQFGTITVTISTSNYQDITLTINVSAKNRITPTGTPTLSKNAITYGDALNTIALSGKLHDNVNNVDVDGTFEWVDGTHIPVVGNGTYAAEWIFEPTDTEKYLTVSGRSNITVEKTQQYGKVSMAGYTYGKTPSTPTLTDRTGDLNAQVTYSYAAADSGSVQTWDISNPPALNAGTYRMYASIGDTDNYYGFEAVYCEFVVAKATPTYTAPTGLTAKYGQTLADVTLPDGWSWTDSSESVGGASTAAKTFQAKFTPKDTENYNTVENIELEVMVNKADGRNLKTVELEQKYTDTSEHTYTPDWAGLPAGQDWTFSSEATIVLPKQDFAADGSLLTYANSGGKAGDKITITLKASCDNYEDFTITLNVTLTEKDDQKPLTITGAGSVVYGQTLTLTTTGGSGTGTVTYRIDTAHSTGEATIDSNTGVLTPAKVGSVSVVATKAGDNDYNDVTSAPFVLMIKPATPTGEPNYTKITTSVKTLKDAALTTKGSTLNPSDGKLEWVDDKGEPLPDDTTVKANTTYKWRFTPDDDNYTTLTGSIQLWHKSTSSGGGSYYAPTVPDTPMLYRGCTGDAVKTLQDKLNTLGYNSGNVDGIFGAKTYAAVTAFQKANNLGVDGIVGKLTWAKLYGVSPAMPVETTVVGRPMVSYGSRGDAVRKLQELLNALGYDCGSVDGIFGSKTKAAVLVFQKANGLAADGIVGPLTWGKLV